MCKGEGVKNEKKLRMYFVNAPILIGQSLNIFSRPYYDPSTGLDSIAKEIPTKHLKRD